MGKGEAGMTPQRQNEQSGGTNQAIERNPDGSPGGPPG
jgi:hypothetical protein